MQYPRKAELRSDGWAGRRTHPVRVVGGTPKKYRIEAIEAMRLAGRNRTLEAGKRALVPRYAVRFLDDDK